MFSQVSIKQSYLSKNMKIFSFGSVKNDNKHPSEMRN